MEYRKLVLDIRFKTCGNISSSLTSSVSQHDYGLSFNFNHQTFRGVLKLKIIKLRNISFCNMDLEILKAAILASKSTMLKGEDVTTLKMPSKMVPGGGNNAKANEWNFYG